jgi:RNA polymerase sigma factor (TIGR02999 family)
MKSMEGADAKSSPALPDRPPEAEALLAQVYDQLRAIARQRIARESPGHTLQATALVHEAYMKLCRESSLFELDKSRFVFVAAEAMRRILIDHARTRGRAKRGGGADAKRERIGVTKIADVADLADGQDPDQIVALDEAIHRLEKEDPQAASVVKLRFYAGLSVAETAQSIGLSERTVKRDWQFARAWLFRTLNE